MSDTGDGQFDAIVIGAGVSGLCQLHALRGLGLRAVVLEAGGGLGGTWYWNRYPGCRFDSESYTYAFSFDDGLLADWDWSEHFSAQPETLAYLEFVADRLDLRRDLRFDHRVRTAAFDDAGGHWTVTADRPDGPATFEARYLITAVGALSTPTFPVIEGLDPTTGDDVFDGPSHHTGLWPHEPVDLAGKRVGVIGTGASGVQVIQEIAKAADHLTVFQRRPNWCAPLHNTAITDDEQPALKARYGELYQRCAETFGGFVHDADRRKALEVSEEERLENWERLYAEPGFGIWMGNFRDVLVNAEANRLMSEFAAQKIRDRVDDPDLAERLIPTDHGFGTRRVPMETNYYEVYNQPNVRLVDLRDTPISAIVPQGVSTLSPDGVEIHELDLLVYATGFDAVTGAFDRIEFTGAGGQRLRDRWSDGPLTHLGTQIPGFPNLFMLVGPHNAATFCNMPRCIEQNVDFVSTLITENERRETATVAPTEHAAAEWTEHVGQMADRMLFSKIDSWFTGVNKNQPEHLQRRVLLYAGGAPRHRDACDAETADGFPGFEFR